jgi:hypothetical protein
MNLSLVNQIVKGSYASSNNADYEPLKQEVQKRLGDYESVQLERKENKHLPIETLQIASKSH